MEPAIAIQELSVTFRGGRWSPPVEALRAVDLEVQRGKIVGLLGPNGSGKTTLLRVLAGLQRPTAGSARVLGTAPGDRGLAQRVGYQPEGSPPFPNLGARDLLVYLGRLMGLSSARSNEAAGLWLERVGLERIGRRAVRTFSTGMQRRLTLAASLMADPDVLLLDEPTAGLDPEGSSTAVELLQERAAKGAAVLLASHHLQEVEQMCHEVAVLRDGRLHARGTLDELLGTHDSELLVRGLDGTAMRAVHAAIRDAGGEIVRSGPARRHIFELFRALRSDGEADTR